MHFPLHDLAVAKVDQVLHNTIEPVITREDASAAGMMCIFPHKAQKKHARQKEYETVYPDLCIFVGDCLDRVHLFIIVEVGFFHPPL